MPRRCGTSRRSMPKRTQKRTLAKEVTTTAGDLIVEGTIEPIRFSGKVLSGKLHKK